MACDRLACATCLGEARASAKHGLDVRRRDARPDQVVELHDPKGGSQSVRHALRCRGLCSQANWFAIWKVFGSWRFTSNNNHTIVNWMTRFGSRYKVECGNISKVWGVVVLGLASAVASRRRTSKSSLAEARATPRCVAQASRSKAKAATGHCIRVPDIPGQVTARVTANLSNNPRSNPP